jgi:hypothetical protein
MVIDLDEYLQRTRSAKRVEARAKQEGVRFRLKHAFNEQCLLALVRESFGTAARTLRANDVDLPTLRRLRQRRSELYTRASVQPELRGRLQQSRLALVDLSRREVP